MAGDQGVFLSVAGRMLDGDRLYADVFDNKDPLFFYTYAGAFWVGGWRGPFLLDAVWLGLAGVAVALLARALGAPRSAVVASFFVYPLTLAAGWYLVGLSLLAASRGRPARPLALAPQAVRLGRRRRRCRAAPQAQPRAARSGTARRATRARGAHRASAARPCPRDPRDGWSARDGCVVPRRARRARRVSRGDRPQRPLLERAHDRRRSRRSRSGAPERRVGVLLSRGPVAGAARRSRARRVRRRRRSGVGAGKTRGAAARRRRGSRRSQRLRRRRLDRVRVGSISSCSRTPPPSSPLR